MGLMRALLLAVSVLGLAACSQRSLKAAGSECVATSQCQEGLTCDFGADPPVCADSQSGGHPDAAVVTPDGQPTPDAPAPADAGVDAS